MFSIEDISTFSDEDDYSKNCFKIESSKNKNLFCNTCNRATSVKNTGEFIEKFTDTYPVMKKIKLPKNIIIAGGSVVANIINRPSRSQDIDLFVLLPDLNENNNVEEEEEEKEEKEKKEFDHDKYIITTIENFINDEIISNNFHKLSILYTKETLNINFEFQNRNYKLQIMLCGWRSIESILDSFDIGSSCAAFDGNRVYLNLRGINSLKYRYNILDLNRYYKTYNSRIIKYWNRGFDIIIPNFTKEDFMKFIKKDHKKARNMNDSDTDSDYSEKDVKNKDDSDSDDSFDLKPSRRSGQRHETYDYYYGSIIFGHFVIGAKYTNNRIYNNKVVTNIIKLYKEPLPKQKEKENKSKTSKTSQTSKTSKTSQTSKTLQFYQSCKDYVCFFKNLTLYKNSHIVLIKEIKNIDFGIEFNFRIWNNNISSKFAFKYGKILIEDTDQKANKINVSNLSKITSSKNITEIKNKYFLITPTNELIIPFENNYIKQRNIITLTQWLNREKIKMVIINSNKFTKVNLNDNSTRYFKKKEEKKKKPKSKKPKNKNNKSKSREY